MLTQTASSPHVIVATAMPYEVTASDRELTILHSAPPTENRDVADDFDRHFERLPSLDDIETELRASSPDFDRYLEDARVSRRRSLMKEVDQGQLSRVAAERTLKGMTQSQLARAAGMRQSNISRIEKPGYVMSPRTARRLAAALSVDDYRELLP